MSNLNQSTESSLVKNIARFSHAASAIATFLLAPLIAKNMRLEMFHYLLTEYSRDVAYWGSWCFIAVVILASFFGISALLQLLVQAVIRAFSRKGAF